MVAKDQKELSNSKNRVVTTKEQYLRLSLFWLGVIVFIVLPLINYLVLQTVMLSVENDIAYGNLSDTISVIQDIISALNSYIGLGILACAAAHFGTDSGGTVILAFSYNFVIFFSSMLSYIYAGGSSIAEAIIYLGIDAVANTAFYAVIYGILLKIRSKKLDSKQPSVSKLENKLYANGGSFTYIKTTTFIFGGAQLAAMLYNMIDAFIDPSIGTPINAAEWIYWITEYLSVIVYAAIGYFIMLAIFYLAQHFLKHFNDKQLTVGN